MFGGEYFNDNGKLPQKAGRKWYEADINYETGKRNKSEFFFQMMDLFLLHMTITKLFTKLNEEGILWNR